MHRCFLIFLVIAAGCSAAPTPQDSGTVKGPPSSKDITAEKRPQHDYSQWKQYAPKEATFKVRFPSDPLLQTSSQGGQTLHVAGIQRQGVNSLGYICQWQLKDKPYSSRELETAYLKGQQEGLLKSSNGRLAEEKEIMLGNAPGRDFTVEVADQNVLHCRVYVVDKQVINLQVWGIDKKAVSSNEAVKFLDSLTLGN